MKNGCNLVAMLPARKTRRQVPCNQSSEMAEDGQRGLLQKRHRALICRIGNIHLSPFLACG